MPLRRVFALAVFTAAVTAAALVAPAGADAPAARSFAYGARSEAPRILFRNGQARAGFTGGPITASDGETVQVYVQDELLAADPSMSQHWADVLAGLLHGPEIANLSLYLATLQRVTQICGAGALGCYGDDQIVAIGQGIRGVSAESVVTHEYGHHVAGNRFNDPWNAVDWGTKRWSSYLHVCERSLSGELVPGDEGRYYEFNPGEAFAEDYRVLNERQAGIPESAWEVVDQSLYPDQQSLDLLAQDVTSPWTGSATTTYKAVLSARASGRGFLVSTPLDGDFRVKLVAPPRAKLTLRIVDLTSGKALATDATPLRVKTLGVLVCGQRTLQVQVKRVSGAGAFTLVVSTP